MTASSFDSTHSVRFDVAKGAVRTAQDGRDGERVLLIPAEALEELLLSAPAEAVRELGRSLGAGIGRRAAARIGDLQAATIEAVVTQLAGEAAVAGVGALSVERWGRALVMVVEDSPLVGTLLVPLVAAAVEAACARRVAATLLSRDERAARILLASESSAERVREWIAAGVAWGDALVRLHGGAA